MVQESSCPLDTQIGLVGVLKLASSSNFRWFAVRVGRDFSTNFHGGAVRSLYDSFSISIAYPMMLRLRMAFPIRHAPPNGLGT